tara:strand:- start:581 stop:817 length:237 start_codon:yes stop_codon:yes gene_type:complete
MLDMTYLSHLKRSNHCSACRWIVKRDSKTNLIREVKLVYNPDEYSKENARVYGNKARKLYTRKGLIGVLETDKAKRSV